jgi:beta-glucanase (GH16 family)
VTGPAVARGAAALATVLLVTACSSGGRPPLAGGGWQRDLHETFSGNRLDKSTWTTCYWWATDGCTIASNDEAEWYRPEQVSVRDGALQLEAKAKQTHRDGKDLSHVSGMVSTGRSGDSPKDHARHAFTYGYVEVRFRTPKGQGLWPAIWLLPADNRSLPEIDMLEQHGDDTTSVSMTLHTAGGRDPEVLRKQVHTADLSQGWHTVGLDWSKGRLRWFLDGIEQYVVTGDGVPSEPMYLIMNLAVGGSAGTPGSPSTFPARFLVDEVSMWQRN